MRRQGDQVLHQARRLQSRAQRERFGRGDSDGDRVPHASDAPTLTLVEERKRVRMHKAILGAVDHYRLSLDRLHRDAPGPVDLAVESTKESLEHRRRRPEPQILNRDLHPGKRLFLLAADVCADDSDRRGHGLLVGARHARTECPLTAVRNGAEEGNLALLGRPAHP